MTDRLRSMRPKALEVFESALNAANLKAAVEVLKAKGIHGLRRPGRADPPADVEAAEAEAEAAREQRALMRHEVPCHHKLEECIDARLNAGGIAGGKKAPLFRRYERATR